MAPILPFLALAFAEDLSVSSNVRGLSIVVNGEDTGLKTPAVVRGLSPGTVTVQVGDACRAGEAVADVRAGAESRVNIHAEEQLAMLTVAVKPAQAVVDVNGGKVRVSPNVPVGLPCGTYEISASLKGYATAAYTLELIGGQELELPIELERLGVSTVEVSVEPRSASIWFDGREVGSDAASLPAVYEGLHVLEAKAKGYNDLEVPVYVSGGDGLVFRVELGRGDDLGDVVAVGGAGKTALAKGREAAREAGKGGAEPDEEEDEPKPKAKATASKKDDDEDDDEDLDAEPDEDEDEDLDAEPEEDDDAEPKSWSERHSSSSKESEDKPKAKPAKVAKAEDGEVETFDLDSGSEIDKPKNPKAPLRITGGVLLGVGAVVAGGGGYYTWTVANETYAVWQGMDEAANNAQGEADSKRLRALADTYYVEQFAPRGNLMIGTFVAGGLLAATGVVLLVVDADGMPVVVPTTGGAVVGWSGSF